jgi:hypothetical protein
MLVFSRSDQVAWSAHIGGMVAGALLVVVLRRPGVELFDGGALLPERAQGSILGHAVPAAPSELP